MTRLRYTPDDYNDAHVLKIPVTLGLTMAYSAKYLLLFLLPYLPTMGESLNFLKTANATRPHVLLFLASLPGATVGFIGFARRIPTAGRPARWIWRHGRLLLSAALCLEYLFFAVQIARAERTLDGPLLAFAYFSFLCLVYLWTSTRAREVFQEFPESSGR